MSAKEPKKRDKLTGKLAIVIIVSAVLMLASLVMLFFVTKKEAALEGADRAIRLSAQGGFSCEYAEAQKLYPFYEGVIKVTNDRIAYLTMSGNDVFSVSVAYANPQCYVSGDRAVVFDANGYSFTVIRNEELVYTKPTVDKIKAVALSSGGLCAVITDGADSYGELIVYNEKGDILFKWSSYNSGYPLCCSFNDSEDMLAVSTINTNGAEYKPYVKVFSLKDINGNLSVSDYAYYTFDNADILSSIMYVGDELLTFSSEGIYQVADDQLKLIGTDFGTINYVTRVGDNIFVIYSEGVEQLNKLAVITTSGGTNYNSPIGSEVNAVTTDGSRYAVCIDKKIFVYNKSGSVLADISVDEDILRIGFIGSDKLVVVSTSGVHTVNI